MKSANSKCCYLLLCMSVSLLGKTLASNPSEHQNGTYDLAGNRISDNIEDTPWERLQIDLQAAQEAGVSNSVRRLNRIDLELRWKIAEQGGIPKWDGEKLMDVSDSICGAEELDFEAKTLLAKLNYWEQAYGTTSIPQELRDTMAGGEADAAIELYVLQLEERGISVELDVDEGLWKVVKDGVD